MFSGTANGASSAVRPLSNPPAAQRYGLGLARAAAEALPGFVTAERLPGCLGHSGSQAVGQTQLEFDEACFIHQTVAVYAQKCVCFLLTSCLFLSGMKEIPEPAELLKGDHDD